jgi:SAM-dependent methyltransferase
VAEADERDDHVQRNRAAWDTWAPDWVDPGRRSWAHDDVVWGEFDVPERVVGALPDVAGLDVVELGCGTAYLSGWLARRGARPVGVDASAGQLATAAALQAEHGVAFPLLHASAEDTPLRAACCDLVVSEYGASIWCDPHRWIPEAARLLRPGGELVFLVTGTLLLLCMVDGEEAAVASPVLQRDYFGMHRFQWADDPQGSVEFHLGYGDWIRVLRRHGFEVEDLIEVRPPPGATTRFPYVDGNWARRWPCEEIWRARRV